MTSPIPLNRVCLVCCSLSLSLCLALSGWARVPVKPDLPLAEVWDVVQANAEKVQTLHMQGKASWLESEWSSPFVFAYERPSMFRIETGDRDLLVVNGSDALYLKQFRDLARYVQTTDNEWLTDPTMQLQWFVPFWSLVFFPEPTGFSHGTDPLFMAGDHMGLPRTLYIAHWGHQVWVGREYLLLDAHPNLAAEFVLSRRPDAIVHDVPCFVVRWAPLLPIAGGMTRTVWIEQERGVVRRIQVENWLSDSTLSMGVFIFQIDFDHVEVNQPLPEGFFDLTPPEGARRRASPDRLFLYLEGPLGDDPSAVAELEATLSEGELESYREEIEVFAWPGDDLDD